MSLAGFAANRVVLKGPKCWACGIPEAEEMAKGYRAGIGPAAIRAWLIAEKGYALEQATRSRVTEHLHSHVGKSS